MEIRPDDITWDLFEQCHAYSDKNVNNADQRLKMTARERLCTYGKVAYPVPDGLTPKGKPKYKWVQETCTACKGSGYVPSRYAKAFSKMLAVLLKYADPAVTDIDSNELPSEFTPRHGSEYGY
jgi:hypothetical protein